MASRTDDEFQKIRSEYLGAGTYVVLPGGEGVAVNTTFGVQAVGFDSKALWQADLGERCLGLAECGDDALWANTLHGVHRLSFTGEVLGSSQTRNEIAHGPVPTADGMYLVTLTRIFSVDPEGQTRWAYRFRESLGEGVRAVLVVGVYPLRRGVLVGAVDYNSGLGRVMVIDDEGKLAWQSEVGPVSSLTPLRNDEFYYTLTGYGRFESFRCGLDGEVRWSLPYGGTARELDDGRLVVLVGSNESPTWDNWHFRVLSAEGAELRTREFPGHCAYPPSRGSDGEFYFSSYFKPIDPSESRIEYTSYVTHPNFLVFDYLLRVKTASHQYKVYYWKAALDGNPELLFEDDASIALGPTVTRENRVFFVHNRNILTREI